MMTSTTLRRSAVSASGVIEISTWFEESTGTFVSWLTGIGSSLTLRRRAYSCASIQAGPLHASPWPDMFSISQGALASTPTRSAPAFRIASTRGLAADAHRPDPRNSDSAPSVRRKRHGVSQLAAEQRMDRQVERFAHDVEAGELERRQPTAGGCYRASPSGSRSSSAGPR